MSLNQLKLAQPEADLIKNPVERAKRKLIGNLRHQVEVAKAELRGEQLSTSHKVTSEVDGEPRTKLIERPVRAWYRKDLSGEYRLTLRVRNRSLEIQPGKTDIIIDVLKEVPPTIQTVMGAVENGDLDKQISEIVAKKGTK